MGFHQRIWTSETNSDFKSYTDSLYIYDAGDFIGYLTEKNGKKRWAGYSLISRERNQDIIEETLEPANEFSVPMKFYSIEQYPAKIEPSILWIPGWKIQLKQPRESGEQQRQQQQQDSQKSVHLPLKQQQHPKQNQPSPQPSLSRRSPSSHQPPRLSSERRGQSQHSSQNKNNSASKPKASLSSNQVFHEKPKQSTPKKLEAHPSQSFPADHISPLSEWYPISPLSPCPPPPSKPEGSNLQSTSSSPNRSSSKRRLPSQQAQRPHGGKSRRPISAQPSSHE